MSVVVGGDVSANRGIDVAGEYIRKNIVEKQQGVELTLDLQVLDITTCEPIKGAYLEIWRKPRPIPQHQPTPSNTL